MISDPLAQPNESAVLLGPSGKDPMARIVDALAPHTKMLSAHKYGNFALQRTIELGDPAEALRLAMPFLNDAWGVYEAGGGTAAHLKHRNPAAFVLQAAVQRVVRSLL